jgi:hypothetical protein
VLGLEDRPGQPYANRVGSPRLRTVRLLDPVLIQFRPCQIPGPAAMTDTRSAAQIFADIFGPAPTERERSLIVRVALLENDILELEAANETLQRQNLELIDRIKTLKGRL